MNDLDARLAELAAAGGTITYGALARDLGLRMGELTAMLEAGMAADAAAGHPLRAAVMAGRLSERLPARGFFDTAAALGYTVADPAGFAAQHRRELRQLHGIAGQAG